MYENIKVIVCDIDGTIARQSSEPTPVCIECLEKLREMGYLIALASGRCIEDLEIKYKTWGMKDQFDFIIALNGVELWDNLTKQKSEYLLMKKEWLREIVELMAPFPHHTSMYIPGGYMSDNPKDIERHTKKHSERKRVFAETDYDFCKEDRGGIMFRVTEESMPLVEAHLAAHPSEHFVGFKTQPDLMEFAHKDCSKGVALEKFCERHNISLDDVMAFGDTTNDIGMLKICHGICMINGSDDAKAVSERLSDKPDTEEGFVDFCEKYLYR